MTNLLKLMNSNGDLLGIGIELIANMLSEEPCSEIRGSRLYANLRNHDGARVLCDIFVLFDHAAHPDRLASHVKIVSARLSAYLEDLLAILAVRTNGRDHYFGLDCKRLEPLFVTNIGDFYACENRPVSDHLVIRDDNIESVSGC